MANPSLQIGNGKFAIKENDLLGYSSSGTKFFPIPITMTRATLGTRVNPSGLVEDVALLGSELVSCGDFACADPNAEWTEGTGWTISGGKATHTGATGNLSQDVGIGGKTIFLTFDILSIADGVCNVYDISNATTYASFSTTGTKTLYFNSVSNSIGFRSNSTNVSIDNISVKEATLDGLARVDYTDGTGSLLVEPQRTNLITYSEDFSNPSWLKVNSTVNPNTSVSPDGTLNSDEFIPDNTTASIFIYNQVTFSASDYTLSFFIKYNGRQYVQLLFGSGASSDFSNFDLINHTVTSGNGSIEDYGNDWYKISLTSNVSAGASEVYLWSIDSATSLRAASSTGNGTDGYYVYGGQLEQGSYPTSYIKTQGSTVTRNKDEYTKTGISDKINSEEGVLFVEMAALANDGNTRYLSLNDGTTNNRVTILYYSGNNNIRTIISSGGSNIVDKNTGVTSALDFHKIAVKWKENDFALWVDGVERKTDTSGLAPTGLNTLSFDQLGFDNLFGKVRQLQVFKTALSDSELATLTT